MAFLIALALVTLLAAAVTARRQRERRLRVWAEALSPEADAAYASEARAVARQMQTLDDTYELAAARRREGNADEAQRLLEVGRDSLDVFVPGRIARLHDLLALARAVSAMLPVPPIAVTAFRLWRLAVAAARTRARHAVSPGYARRFRLRVKLLIHGFTLIARAIRQATERARHAEAGWRTIGAARADLHTLNTDTLESYRLVLGAVERESAAGGGTPAH